MDTLKEQIARYSKLASNGVMTLNAETLAQAAQEAPEHRVELGVMERYHGQRLGVNNAIEHYYRVTLVAAVYARCGSDESAQYPIQRVIQHSEELAQVTREGVREIDSRDAWFTVTRNAVIHLSEKIMKELTAQAPGTDSRWRRGLVKADHAIAWNDGAPPTGAPVEWLRPSGEVHAINGESLGEFERPVTPSLGFLNTQGLPTEKLEPGDTLRYQATSVLPVAGLALEATSFPPDWLPEPHWRLRLAAEALSRKLDIRIIPLEQSTKERVERILVLNVSSLKSDSRQDGADFSAQWRLRVVDALSGTGGTPSFKTGVQADTHIGRESGTAALNPPDLSGWGLKYFVDSLDRLAAMASSKGATAAMTAAHSGEIQN
jgi:hypothetical protein